MPAEKPVSEIRSRAGQPVLWIIAILLAVIATALWARTSDPLLPSAFAQNRALAGAGGVYAFTGQLDSDRYGLFMLDIDQGTIWCYELDNVAGARRLRLVAARTWIYDRYLQDFNNAPPDFRMVQELIAEQRSMSGEQGDTELGGNEAGTSDPDPDQPNK